jgi:hypothetical protein
MGVAQVTSVPVAMTAADLAAAAPVTPAASTATAAAATAASTPAGMAAAAGSALGTASPSTFGASLTRAVVDARSLQTVTLGDMVASATSGAGARAAGFASSATSGAFTAQLHRPTGRTSSAGIGAPGASAPSSRPAVPAELQQYGNGRVPAEALAEIGIGRHRLWAPAAEAFAAMRSAAAADGVEIGVTDSYRSYDEQVDLAQRKGLYKNGGLAAVPGTSQHGWGRALDVDVDPAGLAWMRENAPRFGWVEPVPREPWHWEFWGVEA